MDPIRPYQTVVLKDGRKGCVVEIYGEQDRFDVDVGSSPDDWETVYVGREDIARVLS